MSQDWVDNDEGAGGDTVKQGLINLEQKLDSVRSEFGGSAFPTDAARIVGQACWRTDGGAPSGVGLYRLTVKDPVPASDTWKFMGGDEGISTFIETLLVAVDAPAARTTLGVGTAGTLTTGTGVGEIRTNSQTDALVALVANNLSDLANAAIARANLGLDVLATLATVGAGQIAAGAVARVALGTVEQSFLFTAQSGTYTAAAMEHVHATVATSWTLSLPASPVLSERVSVTITSTTDVGILTIDGNGNDVKDVGTTTLDLYSVDDAVELFWSGSLWIVRRLHTAPHRSQMSVTGFVRGAGSSLILVPMDTIDFDNADLSDLTTKQITIRRPGDYKVSIQLLADQSSASHWDIELQKNSSRLQIVAIDDTHDHDSSNIPGGGELVGYYSLVAGDVLDFFQSEQVAASPSSYARLTVLEQR